jgi:hypothetical protein
MAKRKKDIVPVGATSLNYIKDRIFEIRGQRVMLDRDLAELYGIETRVLNQAVRRNINRFPEDFLIVLTDEEWMRLRSQIVTSNLATQSAGAQNNTSKRGGTQYKPFVFTEYGVAMLSSVLRSETAIQVNINIMRAFVAIRHAVAAMQTADLKYEQLSHKVDQLNAYVETILHDQNDINEQQDQLNTEIAVQIEAINDALDELRETKAKPRKRVGYRLKNDKD